MVALDELAGRSGISRATLSRLERAETSPTAALLGRLCTAYGRTGCRACWRRSKPSRPTSSAPVSSRSGPIRRPASGGRTSPPPASGFCTELVLGELSMGAEIAYDAPPVPRPGAPCHGARRRTRSRNRGCHASPPRRRLPALPAGGQLALHLPRARARPLSHRDQQAMKPSAAHLAKPRRP